MRFPTGCLAIVLPLLLAACGGDSAGPDDDGGAPMSATVAGQAWAADGVGSYGVASTALPGTYVISASRVRGTSSSAISITLYHIRGPGTYLLGMGGTTVGGSAVVTDNAAGWGTSLSGNAGTVTISTLTANRIAGTFEFVADAVTGGATGTRQVSDGRFDVALSGTVTPPADNAGHKLSATLGGSVWNAATVVTTSVNPTVFIASSSNDNWSVSFSISNYAGPGAYPLSFTAPGRLITVQRLAKHPQGAACCWGGAGSTGTFNVTTQSAARTIGTFNGTLTPMPGSNVTGNVAISGGTFDLGRQ